MSNPDMIPKQQGLLRPAPEVPREVGVDWGSPGGDRSHFTCNCGWDTDDHNAIVAHLKAHGATRATFTPHTRREPEAALNRHLMLARYLVADAREDYRVRANRIVAGRAVEIVRFAATLERAVGEVSVDQALEALRKFAADFEAGDA